jgi:diacylglycerol kinase
MSEKNEEYKHKHHFDSQRIAISGIITIFRNERNFRIQILVAALVISAGIVLGISHQDWVSVFLLITLVLISESFNSVMEALADTISKEYRLSIAYAKDVSAGAVLISSIASVVSGVAIFTPYILEFLKNLLS